MLGRYQIVRGKRTPGNPLPVGRRIDTRKHTSHCLRPETASVEALLAQPTDAAFARFAKQYKATLAARFARDRRPFDELAELAAKEDVFLGCNCPTRWNPDVKRCHTSFALAFMRRKYPNLVLLAP